MRSDGAKKIKNLQFSNAVGFLDLNCPFLGEVNEICTRVHLLSRQLAALMTIFSLFVCKKTQEEVKGELHRM